MAKAAFVRTELFADWFMPQKFHSVMAAPTLFKDSSSAVIVAFGGRTRADFEADDIAKIDRFAGHFGRALRVRLDGEQIAQELAAANMILDNLRDAILLVDRDVRVRHANAAARATLDAGKAIRLRRGQIEILDAETDAKLAWIVAGGFGGEIRLPHPGTHELIVQLHSCANGLGGADTKFVIVRIIDLGREGERPTPARLRDRFGLTHRQAEVLAELAAGTTESEAARRLSLGEPTLRTHIQRAYDRLELRGRADLMALLARHGFITTTRTPRNN